LKTVELRCRCGRFIARYQMEDDSETKIEFPPCHFCKTQLRVQDGELHLFAKGQDIPEEFDIPRCVA